MIKANMLVTIGIAAVLIGILLIFVGTALQSASKTDGVHAGGVIMIGPIPIIFGTDRSFVFIAMIFAAALMVIFYLLFYRTVN